MEEQNLTLPALYSLLKESMAKQTEEINKNIADNIQKLTGKFEEVNFEIGELQNRNLSLERNARKNNIIVFGLQIQQNEDILEKSLQTLNSLLNLNLQKDDINNVYLLGKTDKAPVKIEFISYLKKISLFRDKNKLKNLKQQSITIADDLCQEDREIHKKLRAHLKQARARNVEARIKGNKLILGTKAYSVNELEEIETTEESNSESEVELIGEKQDKPGTSTIKKKIDVEEVSAQLKNKQKRKKIKTPSPKNITTIKKHKRVK